MRINPLFLLKVVFGLDCWTCEEKTMTDCILYGGPRRCTGHDDVCFVEQRERKGRLVSITQGCKQRNACEQQKRQNFQTRILTRTNCRPEGFLRWPSSACRQCCYSDNCSATWTPKSRSEWSMDMKDADISLFRYEFIFDYSSDEK